MSISEYCTVQQVKDKFIQALPAKFTDSYITDIIKAVSKYISRELGGKAWKSLSDVPIDIQSAAAWLSAAEIALVIFPETPDVSENMTKLGEKRLGVYKREFLKQLL